GQMNALGSPVRSAEATPVAPATRVSAARPLNKIFFKRVLLLAVAVEGDRRPKTLRDCDREARPGGRMRRASSGDAAIVVGDYILRPRSSGPAGVKSGFPLGAEGPRDRPSRAASWQFPATIAERVGDSRAPLQPQAGQLPSDSMSMIASHS